MTEERDALKKQFEAEISETEAKLEEQKRLFHNPEAEVDAREKQKAELDKIREKIEDAKEGLNMQGKARGVIEKFANEQGKIVSDGQQQIAQNNKKTDQKVASAKKADAVEREEIHKARVAQLDKLKAEAARLEKQNKEQKARMKSAEQEHQRKLAAAQEKLERLEAQFRN